MRIAWSFSMGKEKICSDIKDMDIKLESREMATVVYSPDNCEIEGLMSKYIKAFEKKIDG